MNRIFLALLCAWMGGCGTVQFYSQAIKGQAEIMKKARPITAVIHDPLVVASVKRKIAVVQEARRFASKHLGLPGYRQYQRFSDLNRPYVSWVVYAAPEFSVEGKTWWYPVLGHLEYRGYFDKAAAEAEAARLRSRGFEVYVGGVEAYSTLGWLRDPVLNTFLDRTDAELAELIFHELTHVKLFLPGDTDFNEAFATANAESGVRRWLRARGERAALARYNASLAKDREVVRVLMGARQRLNRLYLDKSRSPAQMRVAKAGIIRRMRREISRWGGGSGRDRGIAKPWNNARLNSVATYYDLLPGFERLLKDHHGDLPAFYAAVGRMRWLSKPERRALLLGD